MASLACSARAGAAPATRAPTGTSRSVLVCAVAPASGRPRRGAGASARPFSAVQWDRLAGPTRASSGGQQVTESQQEVTVEDILNPHPVLLDASSSLKEAVHKMLDANVSGAPVVDGQGRLVGVLTETDIIYKGAGRPEDHYIIPPTFLGFLDAYISVRDNKKFDEEVAKILAKTVADAMSKQQLISVTPSTPMSEAAHLMLHHQINLLPVVEGPESKVVGVLTRHDVLRGIYASKNPLLS